MKAFRKFVAAVLASYLDFIRRHPLPSLLLSLVALAACLGALYLAALHLPAYLDLSCFRGGCPK